MHGILPLWKPKGKTSHDCVKIVRDYFRNKKVGHTGTLDPEVEGVLPLCIGKATKIVPFLTDTKKTYIAEVTLGLSTDTQDAHGRMVERKQIDHLPSQRAIEKVIKSFEGNIVQIPPMYSAVKVKGKKLYEYARAGESVDRPRRRVRIFSIEYLHQDDEQHRFSFKVVCSKGTYIRTLCVDIGKTLGYPAHMSKLIRTGTGSFTKADTVTFADIDDAARNDRLNELLLPLNSGLDHLDTVYVDKATKARIRFGQKLSMPDEKPQTDPFLMMYGQKLLAIYQMHPKNPEQIKPVRVLNTEHDC